MDGPTLLRRYAQGKRDFSWADLAKANLAQAQLSGINLSRANLSGATLVGANLSKANLTKANLARANHLFYGVVLRVQQVAWPGWLLVSLPMGLGLWQEELVWFVPLVGLVGAMVALGLSVGVLIFAVPVALGIGVALAIGGSILGWGWGQTLKTTAWFSGLAFVAMHSSIWLFDGSNAYGGGGIVVNLSGIHTAGLLGLGLVAVGRGTLAYGQLIDQGYPTRHQGMLIGGGGVVGLLLGWLVGG
ncbi:MAG: pentapeptide repeat-containing protein [Nodosilinea sp.]